MFENLQGIMVETKPLCVSRVCVCVCVCDVCVYCVRVCVWWPGHLDRFRFCQLFYKSAGCQRTLSQGIFDSVRVRE